MNFFEQQDIARKNTRRLVFLFVLAVLSLVIITNLFLTFFPWQMHSKSFDEGGSNSELACLMAEGCDFWASIDWEQMFWVSVFVVLIIGGVSLFKWFSIAAGGKKIAKMMGGTLIRVDTDDPAEKKLVNVVEEMALASNMPVPAVYVMKEEFGINAFAAGFSTKDAVVAVTQGTLDSLNRDQLQGVVAHEFSHILNGDMRLNMHLIAILHGIMFITEAGFVFLRGSTYSRRDKSGPTLALGLGLVVIGSLGTFFGSLIKAAVSRQREYLADASAVQFTRNPDGIGGALKVIGGSSTGTLINDSHGTELSHLFFGSAVSWAQSFFATHPPIDDRIRKVDPHWDGDYLSPDVATKTRADKEARGQKADFMHKEKLSTLVAAVVLAEEASGNTGFNVEEEPLPQDSLHEPMAAAAAVCCLLLPAKANERKTELAKIETDWPELHDAMDNSPWKFSQREDFLPIVELAVGALRALSEDDYKRLKQQLIKLIRVDGVIDLYEWALYNLLKSNLDAHFDKAVNVRPKFNSVRSLEKEILDIIYMLLHSVDQSDENKLKAFNKACNVCGIYNATADFSTEVKVNEFTVAVKKMTSAYPVIKGRVMKALIDVISIDGRIEKVERNTVIAIGALIDSPLSELQMAILES